MVPFKPYFLGEEAPPWPRAVSIQKVARTVDIDIIGTTARHLTLFEMLGNFSFGDYFRDVAIRYAYDFITGTLGIDPELLWYTVHETDDEAAEIWIDGIGIAADRVQRGGNDNFWQMGVAGPCGPASEIFIDRGSSYGDDGGPIGGGEDRFVELWNLVFMQNIQDEPYTWSAISRPATSTPASAWSDWPWCCRASTRSSRSTACGTYCRTRPAHWGWSTAVRLQPMCRCESWRIMPGRRRSLLATGSCRATKAAATSCDASSGGPSATPGRWGARR